MSAVFWVVGVIGILALIVLGFLYVPSDIVFGLITVSIVVAFFIGVFIWYVNKNS